MSQEEQQSINQLGREHEVLQSSRHSREIGKLRDPQNHTSNKPHSQIVKDESYRTGFTFSEKLSNWLFSCIKCSNSEASFVQTLNNEQRRVPQLSEDDKKLLQNRIMKLKVIQTSRLKLDPNIMHPFVRIHIVDKNTGCYVKNQERTDETSVYHHEEITYFNKVDKKYVSTENDMILPLATACCDFREYGNSKGIWNQKFFINYPAHLLMTPETIILFQILDFNHESLLYKNSQDEYNRDNFYRVAWAFLRPVGIGKTYLGSEKLQLYQYKYNSKNNQNMIGESFIPEVYYDFIWKNHEKYEGFLSVQLTSTQKPKYRIIGEDSIFPKSIFEEQPQDRRYLERFFSAEMSNIEDQDKLKKDEKLLKYYRNRDICEVPDQLIYKFESEQLGCYRLKFISNYIFAACSKKKYTILKGYSLKDGSKKMTLKGHRNVIYSMEVTPNEQYLVTAGSDHLVKIWRIPEDSGEYIDEDESDDLTRGQCIHTAAVYASAVIHFPLQETLYILTCCFDGFIRLWECTLDTHKCQPIKQICINDQTRSVEKVYPTACTVSESNFFIVGDSLGDIRIFDFSKEKFVLRNLIVAEEMKNDSILSIHVLNKNHLMIQASDNLIRHYELLGNKLRLSQSYSGAVFDSELSRCSVSPDNRYLFCPSQSGKPFLWDIFTGGSINLDHLNLNVKRRLVTSDWHPKYNMVAISGFIEYCPIFIFGNVLNENQIKMVTAQLQ